jgi:tRNA pseudouridine55 synthase
VNVASGDFVLAVDKPEGPTSHDVVAMARRALGTRKVGHTGTLDPFASGLLLLCVGGATRLSQYLTGMRKSYEANVRLGIATDTHDHLGEPVGEPMSVSGVDESAVRNALQSFVGPLEQVPPQFSAKKVDGEAMHRKARRGQRVELPPVSVHVYEASLVSWVAPDAVISVSCSTGTYIRAIARDLGEALGVGAHLTALRRVSVGAFDVGSAVSLDGLGDADRVARATLSPVEAMGHLRAVILEAPEVERIRHGQRVRVEDPAEEDGRAASEVVTVQCGVDLVAIADLVDGVLRPRKVFA